MVITFDTNFYRKLVENIDVKDIDKLKTIAQSLTDAEQKKGIVPVMNTCLSLKKVDSKTKSYLCIKTAQKNAKSIMIQ